MAVRGAVSFGAAIKLICGKYIFIFAIFVFTTVMSTSILHLASQEDKGQSGSYVDNNNSEKRKDDSNSQKGLKTTSGDDSEIDYSVANAACKGYYNILKNYTVLQEYEDEKTGEKSYIPLNDRRAKKDALNRDKEMIIDPNILYAMNEYVFSYEYVYPESFLKPVANDDYKLCSISDDKGKVVVSSNKRDKKGSVVGTEKSSADYGISTLCSYKEMTTKTYIKGQYNRKLKINKKTGEEVYETLSEPIPFKTIIISEKTEDVLDKSVSMNASVMYNYETTTNFSAPCTEGEKSENPADNVEMIYDGVETEETEEETEKMCYIVSKKGTHMDKHYFSEKSEADAFIKKNESYEFEIDKNGNFKKKKHKVKVKVQTEWEIYNCRDTSCSGIYIDGYAPGEDEKEEYDNSYLYDYLGHFKAYKPAVERTYETFRNMTSIAEGDSLLSAASNGSSTNVETSGGPWEFIQSIAADCQKDAEESGFLPSVLIAQACLESGYGESKLSQSPNFNFFGMKASSQWIAEGKPTVNMDTREQDSNGNEYWVTATWCVFENFAESLRYHSKLLWNSTGSNGYRYRAAAGVTDFREAVTIIREGGYATDISYVDKLCSVYEKYDLGQFDTVTWNGETPDYATDGGEGSGSFEPARSQVSGMNNKDRDTFYAFFHAVDNPYDGLKSVGEQTKTLSVEEVDEMLRYANTFTFRTTMKDEANQYSHDDLLSMTLYDKLRDSAMYDSTAIAGDDIVEVALAEEGTREEPLGSNNTKYNTWAGMPGAEWCNIFVCWCAEQCGYLNTIIPQIYGCSSTADWYKERGLYRERGTYTPKRGDLVLFNRKGTIGHIGIVVSVDGNIVHTIEGNTSNIVAQKEYDMSSSRIAGYADVQYGSSSNSEN